VSARDRTLVLILIAIAIAAWIAVAVVLTTVSPVGDAVAQLTGALVLGAAVGLTFWPLLWFVSSGRSRGDSYGSLWTAGRRSALIGLVVSILVVLRAIDAASLPVLVFLVATAVLVEVAFTLRR
jgi:hypothetical protein